jgi:hypothetical protein
MERTEGVPPEPAADKLARAEPGPLEIPMPKRRNMIIEIRGVTPLLSARITEQDLLKLQKVQIPVDEQWTQQQVFEGRVYRDEEGRAGFPGGALQKAMIDAGRSVGKPMTVLKQIFTINEVLLPILESVPVLRTDTARNPNAKGALVIAIRAQYQRPWSMLVPIRYNANLAGEKDILALLNTAGFAVGIGAWRPEKNGLFGQFEVTNYERLD